MNFESTKTTPLIIFLTVAMLLLVTAIPGHAYTSAIYQGGCIEGDNIEKTVERDLPIFNILEVSGAFTINILSNQTQQFVKITGDENILPHIATTTSGNKVLIHAKKSICTELGITLDISVGNLYALISSGSDDVKVHELHTDRFSLVAEGSGDIELTGWATRFDADISGSGDLESRGLKAQFTTLNVSGSNSANVHASESLNVSIVGIADVYYSGNPQKVSKDILGVGSLNKIE
ncbi:MAG: head GIN domain-containing protein [Thermodesulfobacteriota bacterium]